MSRVAKNAIILMLIAILSKVFGFGREMVLAYKYGASTISDAYVIALGIPTILGGVFTSIVMGYIPVFSTVKAEGIEAENKFNDNVLTIATLVAVSIILLFYVFANQIVKLFALGFTPEMLEITMRLAVVMIWIMVANLWTNLLAGYLQCKNDFFWPALIVIPQNMVAIASVLLSSTERLYILYYGALLAYSVPALILLYLSWKKGYRPKINLNVHNEHLKSMIGLVIPITISNTVLNINLAIDRTLASGLSEGSVAALNYASMLRGLVHGIFVMAVATVIFPKISSSYAEGETKGIKELVTRSITVISMILIPITVGIIMLSVPIVTLAYGRGRFDSQAITTTAEALKFYSVGIVAMGLTEIAQKVFYASKKSKIPMLNSAITTLINIVLSVLLAKFMAHKGIAFATSISQVIGATGLIVLLSRKADKFDVKTVGIEMIKMSASAIVMGTVIHFAYPRLFFVFGSSTKGQILSLSTTILIGVIAYFTPLLLLKSKDLLSFKEEIKARFNSAP